MSGWEVSIHGYRGFQIGHCCGEKWSLVDASDKYYAYDTKALRPKAVGAYIAEDGSFSDDAQYFDSLDRAKAAIDANIDRGEAFSRSEIKGNPHKHGTLIPGLDKRIMKA